MKAKSKRPDIGPEWRNQRSRRLLVGAGLAVAAFLACNLVDRALAATDAVNACQQTATDVLAGCRASAQSDYQIALGKCVNISDQAARKACQKQAAADLDDALQTCKGGFGVREETCDKLGPAPYDPVIVPADFVAKIDNPFFPLVPGTTFIYEGQTSEGLMGQVIALNESVTVPFGSFTGCVRTKEWSLLESGTDKKWYAKGIGLVRIESTGGEVMTLVTVKHE